MLIPINCIFRSKDVLSDLYRHFDDEVNKHADIDEDEDMKESSLVDNMDMSPSMLSVSSPIKTDWLGQLVKQQL